MSAVYIFSLVLGGGLLLVSLLSGDGGDAELDVDVDVDVDAGGEMDGAAAKILSLRGLIYAAFGFGATGTILSRLGVGTVATAGAAAVTGLAASVLVTWTFNYLRRTASGDLPGDQAFLGAPGRVVLPLSSGSPGAVVVSRGDREIRLRALPHDTAEGDPASWRRIMVVEVEAGIARVVPIKEDTLLTP
ncbi:MAG TPA: hypothetical protein VLA43_14980 [Longimicrobiales bacterium]|nr:hypothetical protein [Longimicrobiales bacterium]